MNANVTNPMSENLKAAEKAVQEVLEHRDQPISVSELVTQVESEKHIREHLLRLAVWNLVSKGLYAMNNRYEVSRLSPSPSPA